MAERLVVDVCICTFRRPSLLETLKTIAAQDLPPAVAVRVVVADNDGTDSARQLCADAARDLGLDLHYVHAPERNISIARNACLDAATASLVAFIDDDELAEPSWLSAMLAAMTDQADVVFGHVVAVYPEDGPAWARTADLHSIQPTILPGGEIRTGYTSNVLMRRAVIGDQRFDPELGRSGGEDTFFFFQLRRRGARLASAPAAIVREPAAHNRLSLGWLTRRSFRSGQTHARLLESTGANRFAAMAVAASKAVVCGVAAVVSVPAGAQWRRQLVRGSLHLGVVAKLSGVSDLKIY